MRYMLRLLPLSTAALIKSKFTLASWLPYGEEELSRQGEAADALEMGKAGGHGRGQPCESICALRIALSPGAPGRFLPRR